MRELPIIDDAMRVNLAYAVNRRLAEDQYEISSKDRLLIRRAVVDEFVRTEPITAAQSNKVDMSKLYDPMIIKYVEDFYDDKDVYFDEPLLLEYNSGTGYELCVFRGGSILEVREYPSGGSTSYIIEYRVLTEDKCSHKTFTNELNNSDDLIYRFNELCFFMGLDFSFGAMRVTCDREYTETIDDHRAACREILNPIVDEMIAKRIKKNAPTDLGSYVNADK